MDYTETKVMKYLDDLRESGVTNMYGAAAFIREQFHVDKQEASRLLQLWMKTFDERHPQ